ncbi:hypothetical protein N0V88_003795 [Collariella sp. IMI 366227]|nr:hypothetical protein N0V88_003795 [Collariella sp. IMI 366227]
MIRLKRVLPPLNDTSRNLILIRLTKRPLRRKIRPGSGLNGRPLAKGANPRALGATAAGEGAQQPTPRPSRRKPLGPGPSAGERLEDRPRKSPTPPKREASKTRSVSPPKRSKGRPAVGDNGEFSRGAYQTGKLWNPDDEAATAQPRPYDKSNLAIVQRQRVSTASRPKQRRQSQLHPAPSQSLTVPVLEELVVLIKQPETRSITQEQLVAEVKGIYAGLVMVESKCIEVDTAQSSAASATELTDEQWQALIALHRTLLHEHHDFFLASQHPSAKPALRRLAAKYAMPARMWRHGIHSFLELLRHRLPQSLDHMLSFICLAYSMIALLYETVPAFSDTWIECLGDLGRYRMAIEDDDIREREVWTSVSRNWYSKASDQSPTTGRLYHHLAILSRPNALQQLYYYSKSLCVELPFPSARDSIMTLFDPILAKAKTPPNARLPPTELAFARTHGILFSGKHNEELVPSMNKFFANPISQAVKITALTPDDDQMQDPETPSSRRTTAENAKKFPHALRLFLGTYNIVCRRFGDNNILSFLHVTLVFIHHLTFLPDAMVHIAPLFPWKLTALMLNTLVRSFDSSAEQQHHVASLLEEEAFPGIEEIIKREEEVENEDKEDVKVKKEESSAEEEKKLLFESVMPRRRRRPLPDDYAIRGFPWIETYLPAGWFETDERVDDDDKYMELASMIEERKNRVLWLGARIAAREGGGKWLTFDSRTRTFGVNPVYEVELDLQMSKVPLTPSGSVDLNLEVIPDAGSVA